jgi:predicted esterase
LLAAFALFLLWLLSSGITTGLPPSSTIQQQQQQQQQGAAGDASPIMLDGTYEDIGGSEVVWQMPAPAQQQPVAGVLLALHGCGHYAGDWFPRSPSCPRCLGLPEELIITRAALARRLAVVAISSLDRDYSKCWDPNPTSDDAVAVERVLTELTRRAPSLAGRPIFAFGASSGGAFALALGARRAPALRGVIAEIMGHPSLAAWVGGGGATGGANAAASKSKPKYPPTAFIHMPRDGDTAALVAVNAAELKQAVRAGGRCLMRGCVGRWRRRYCASLLMIILCNGNFFISLRHQYYNNKTGRASARDRGAPGQSHRRVAGVQSAGAARR